MSELVESLKTEDQDFIISKDDMTTLTEILAFVSVALKSGNLYFNGKGDHNLIYAEFCDVMARRFANMPVENLQ